MERKKCKKCKYTLREIFDPKESTKIIAYKCAYQFCANFGIKMEIAEV